MLARYGVQPVFGKIFPLFRILKEAAGILIRSGELVAAQSINQWITKRRPTELEAYFALSAFAYKQGDRRAARSHLINGIRNRAFATYPVADESAARILHVRGVQNSVYMLGKSRNGDYKVKLRGGNFSDIYLIDRNQHSIISYFILDQNILSDEKVPEFDIVLNLISDPDVEAQSLQSLAVFLARHPDVPVINQPGDVLATTRDNNCRRLSGVKGIRFPRTTRMVMTNITPQDCRQFLETHHYSFPVLVRETGTHFGRSFRKVENFDTFMRYVSKCRGDEIYVIQYQNSMFSDGIFRKMRVFIVDGNIYPAICHFDTIWNVHGNNRREVMLNHSWMMEHEQAFMGDCESYIGNEAFRRLKQLREIIGLDFFGVDFTILNDGDVLVYEVNPAMRHSYDHADDFPYLLPYLKQITTAFGEMVLHKLESRRASR